MAPIRAWPRIGGLPGERGFPHLNPWKPLNRWDPPLNAPPLPGARTEESGPERPSFRPATRLGADTGAMHRFLCGRRTHFWLLHILPKKHIANPKKNITREHQKSFHSATPLPQILASIGEWVLKDRDENVGFPVLLREPSTDSRTYPQAGSPIRIRSTGCRFGAVVRAFCDESPTCGAENTRKRKSLPRRTKSPLGAHHETHEQPEPRSRPRRAGAPLRVDN